MQFPHICTDSSAKYVAVVEQNMLLRSSVDFRLVRTSVLYLFVIKLKFLRCHRIDLSHLQVFPTSWIIPLYYMGVYYEQT